MSKATIVSKRSAPAFPNDRHVGSGWRIKARKPSRSVESVGAHHSDSSSAGYLYKSIKWSGYSGIFASLVAVIFSFTMVTGLLSSWFEPASISHSANAQTKESLEHDGYQLHLGVYQSELEAKLIWTSLQAYPGTTLDGFDPFLKPEKLDVGSEVYHLLTSGIAGFDEADDHCAWLKQHDVACSIIGN